MSVKIVSGGAPAQLLLVGSNQTGQNYDTLVFGDVASHFAKCLDGPTEAAVNAQHVQP
jgi:hypothetical protein